MTVSFDWMPLADTIGAWLSTYLLHSAALLVPALLVNRWLGASRSRPGPDDQLSDGLSSPSLR